MRLAIAVAALVLAVPAAAHAVRTNVWIAAEQPLRVRGTGFAASDRVAVTVRKGGSVFRKTVIASAGGAFRATWRKGLPTVCANTKIVAVGKSGRRATSIVVVNDCPNPSPAS